ncbi:histidine phosphatase family protein [Iamia sp. SCSIO 61187]|nr:histidine phosphatase family protein [Iamia sp. SCSIO 61187]
MTTLWYVSHPEVAIDPDVPVPRWGLSAVGRRRAEALAREPWLGGVRRIIASAEAKAVETAELLAAARGLPVEVRPDTGENDRSATGFVPPDEFERLADAFFARPEESVAGWERAADAQARIVAALADLVGPAADGGGDVVVIGHGAVGTLWSCHLAGDPIDRRWDQPGPGHLFAVDLPTARLLHRWQAF